MKQENQHLDIDLDFLDKKASPRQEEFSNNERKIPHTSKLKLSKSGLKKILIICGVVIFFGWVIFSDNNSGTSTNNSGSYTTSNNDMIIIGEYRCSRYHYDKAVTLSSDESEQQLTTAQNALKYKEKELDRLENEIDNSYVNEYSSQWKINQYNATVNEYNSKLATYKRDVAVLNSRIDKYNTQIEAHNNYLRNNCTPNK